MRCYVFTGTVIGMEDTYANKKVCLRRSCRAWIDADAASCPECGRGQGRVASGLMSGANRRAARYGEITFTFRKAD